MNSGESVRDNLGAVPVAVAASPRSAQATELLRRAPSAYLWNQLGSLWLFAASFLLSLIAARGLGSQRYGVFAFALTFFNTAVYAAAFGLEDAATVFVPRTLAERGVRATGVLLRRLLLARALAVLVVCALVYFVSPSLRAWLATQTFPGAQGAAIVLTIPDFPLLALPLTAYIASTGLMNLLGSLFTALLRTRLTLVVGGLAQVANVAGVYVAARVGFGVAGVIWALAGVAWAAALVYLILLLPLLRREARGDETREAAPFNPVLRLGATAWLTNLISGALLKQAAVSLMGYFLVAFSLVGYFNLAFQLSHAAAFLLIAGLGGVGMAAMAAAYSGADRESLGIAWRSVSKAQILLALPVLAFFYVQANTLAVLFYGRQYAPVGPLMQLFLVFNIGQRLAGGGAHQAALYVLGRQGRAFAAQVAGLLITIGLGVALIPRSGAVGGAAGALIAVGAGQVFVELVQLILVRRLLQFNYPVQFGLRAMLAVAPAIVVAALLPLATLTTTTTGPGVSAVEVTAQNVTNLALSAVIFTAVLLLGLAIARPVEQDDVSLLAGVNPRLRWLLAPFARRGRGATKAD